MQSEENQEACPDVQLEMYEPALNNRQLRMVIQIRTGP
jgi:hypothetical protein